MEARGIRLHIVSESGAQQEEVSDIQGLESPYYLCESRNLQV